MLKKPVVPLHQIRKKNFKITEMKRNQNVRKMNYFMETIELKGQYSHYENENRRLHIHLNKLIKMNREKMANQNHIRLEEGDSTFDLNTKNDQNQNEHNISVDANQDIGTLKRIAMDLQWDVDSKNREIENLKLIKRELSERELNDTIFF